MVQPPLSDWGLHCLGTKPSTHEPTGDISYPNHNKLTCSMCAGCFHTVCQTLPCLYLWTFPHSRYDSHHPQFPVLLGIFFLITEVVFLFRCEYTHDLSWPERDDLLPCLLYLLIYVYVLVWLCKYHVCRCLQRTEGSKFSGLELQVLMSHLVWVLE